MILSCLHRLPLHLAFWEAMHTVSLAGASLICTAAAACARAAQCLGLGAWFAQKEQLSLPCATLNSGVKRNRGCYRGLQHLLGIQNNLKEHRFLRYGLLGADQPAVFMVKDDLNKQHACCRLNKQCMEHGYF